jgi:hypothetical protein
MARDPNHPDNSDPSDQKFLSQIETYGWNVTNVFRREGEIGPDWSYSTGLFHSFQHPEIVIFGLELDNMQKIVNTIGSAIKGGARFESGNEYQDILARCGCQFRTVDASRYKDYLGWAIWFYNGEQFPVCNVFGRTARDTILEPRLVLRVSPLCSRYFSSLRKNYFRCTAASVALYPPLPFFTFGMPYFGLMSWQPSSQ